MNYLNKFLELYCNFLEVDLIYSFKKSRNIRIINTSFLIFYAILSKKTDSSKKETLLTYFEDLIEKYTNKKDEVILCSTHNDLKNIKSLYNLHESLNMFAEALKYYNKLFKNQLFKQALIECHNALSHIVAGYMKSNTNLDINILKASNHFHRGALDIYKVIIINNLDKIDIDTLKQLRKKEFESIGLETSKNSIKNDILKEYKNLIKDL